MNHIIYIPHVLIVEFDKFNELYGTSSYKQIKDKIFELLKRNLKRITLKHKEGNVADEIGYSFYIDFKNVSNDYVRNVAQSFGKLSYYDVDIDSDLSFDAEFNPNDDIYCIGQEIIFENAAILTVNLPFSTLCEQKQFEKSVAELTLSTYYYCVYDDYLKTNTNHDNYVYINKQLSQSKINTLRRKLNPRKYLELEFMENFVLMHLNMESLYIK